MRRSASPEREQVCWWVDELSDGEVERIEADCDGSDRSGRGVVECLIGSREVRDRIVEWGRVGGVGGRGIPWLLELRLLLSQLLVHFFFHYFAGNGYLDFGIESSRTYK